MLIKSYKAFIKNYNKACQNFRDFIIKIESQFLQEKNFKSYVETPFFQFGLEIKNLLKAQKKQLDSILKNQVFKLEQSLENLCDELSHLKGYDRNQKGLLNSFHKCLNDLERKVIDDYINDKYEKHIKDISNDKLENIKLSIAYLQNSFSLIKDDYKDDLVKNNNALVKVFNEMKTGVKELIVTLKENRKDYLDELQKNVDSFSFGEKIEENENEKNEDNKNEIIEENKNEIIQDNKVDNKKEEGKINDLNKFIDEKLKIPKYNLKLLNNPTFEVTKAKDGKKNTYEKLTLNNEEIYFIVRRIYGCDIDVIDKTEYDLDRQVTVRSLSNKLLLSNIKDEEHKILLNRLDNEDDILIFLEELNNFRAGNKSFDDQKFSFVTEIFKKVIEKMSIKHNKKIEPYIFILSQTFFKTTENNKKVYISDEIKDHK